MNSKKTNTQTLPTTTISQHNKKCHFRQTVLETPFSVKSDALIPGILHLIPGTTPEKKKKKNTVTNLKEFETGVDAGCGQAGTCP